MVLHRPTEGLQDIIIDNTTNAEEDIIGELVHPRKHVILGHHIMFLVASNWDETVIPFIQFFLLGMSLLCFKLIFKPF